MTEPERWTWDLFIAHASRDKPSAKALYDALAGDARVFLDSRCVELGDDWDTAIDQAQRASQVTVVLVSPHLGRAYYAREEIAAAIRWSRDDTQAHRVVPVFLAGDDGEAMHYGLRLKQGVHAAAVGGMAGVARELLGLLARLQGGVTGRRPPTGPAAREPLRLLHLSDLHFRASTQWDAEPLLTGLAQAVAGLCARGLAPHAVVLTGDVAYSARAAEYKLAGEWLCTQLLPAAGLCPEALFVVPGNHDIDRGTCQSVVVQSTEAALRGGPDRVVAEVLGDPAQWGPLAPRHAPYCQFLADLGVTHPHQPRWAELCRLAGRQVLLVGMDTAWLASGDAMKGRLVLGLAQVNALTVRHRDVDLVVGLCHHPLDWLTEWDQGDVEPPLQARLHLLLRGHLHKARPVHKQGAAHAMVELPAGSAYAGSKWANTFQLVEIDQATVCTHVYAWVAEHDAWVPDATHFPPAGVVCLPLPGRTAARGPAPQSEAGPVPGAFTNHFHGDTGPLVQVTGGSHSFNFVTPKKG